MSLYPKRYNIKISQLPFVCSQAVLVELLRSPQEVNFIESLHRFTEKSNNGELYNGIAVTQVATPNKNAEENLRTWSFQARTTENVEWNDSLIHFHVPAIHHSSFAIHRAPMGTAAFACSAN